MMKTIKIFFLISIVFLLPRIGTSQVSITGPTCVVPGVIYQYQIQGNWDSTSTMQVCLSGGVIADSTDTNICTPAGGAPLSSVLVIWNGGSGGSFCFDIVVISFF